MGGGAEPNWEQEANEGLTAWLTEHSHRAVAALISFDEFMPPLALFLYKSESAFLDKS